MLDYAAIDWARLKAPSPLFRVFVEPTPWQFAEIVGRLRNDYLYAPDELRQAPGAIEGLVSHYFCSGSNIIYEVGDFHGILGILDILPEHKANVTLKLWGAEAWGRDFVRGARGLLDAVMDAFKLVRLDTSTPDMRVVRMAKMTGFEIEGMRPKDFKWNGEYFDTTIMGLIRE